VFCCVLFFAYKDKDVESGVYRVVNVMGDSRRSVSTGTGFKVAEPGIVVTNYHVVRGARTLVVLYKENDAVKEMPVKVVWQDRELDLALLQTRADIPGAALTLADISEEDLHKRDAVEAIGFPGAADDLAKYSAVSAVSDITFIDATVTTGTVQRQVSSQTRATIQHSADVNSGNSGGPLLDSCQRVIGVNTLSQSAEIRGDQMVDALTRFGVYNFQAPGALESAVHVSEVIPVLRTQKIPTRISSGRCHSGVDRGEAWTLGISGAVSLASLALAGVAVLTRNGRRPVPGGDFDMPVPGETGAGGTTIAPLVPGSSLELVREADGHRFDLSVFGELLEQGGITIGRGGGGADLLLPDQSISRQHAVIRRLPDGSFIIRDLKSTNGTKVDGMAVGDGQSVVIGNGSEIVLGDSRFTVKAVRNDAEPEPALARDNASAWLLSGFDDQGRVFQHAFHDVDEGAHAVVGDLVRIGRSSDNDLIFDHKSVSRNHAKLFLSNDGSLCLADLNSSNGTFVDGHRVGSRPTVIGPGQQLQFGIITASLSRQS
jgi:pSer/pThr/pTyr-binding forkhead associated (FHA) protein/S1-C subfamily serine protease